MFDAWLGMQSQSSFHISHDTTTTNSLSLNRDVVVGNKVNKNNWHIPKNEHEIMRTIS